MANEQNLKPIQKGSRSREEVKKTSSKGGIKSGEVRRQKRSIREAMQSLLDSTYNLKDSKTDEVRTVTGEQAIALSIMNTAMNPKHKNWRAAVQYALQLVGEDKSENENKLIEAQAKMLQAKADIMTGADTTTLDKLDDILREIRADALKGDD